MDQRLDLDRNSFEQVIATASLLQQLQKRAKFLGSSAGQDTAGLVDLVDVQQAIQSGTLSQNAAINRIAALALEVVPAQGAGVWLFNRDELVYRAGAGAAPMVERLHSAVLARLDAGPSPHSFMAEDANDIAGAESLLVAPIYRGATIAGALAVFSSSSNCFSERDQAETRLLAGLVTLALDRAANARFKHTVTLERAAVLQVIGTLVPSLERMAEREQHLDTQPVSVGDSAGAGLNKILVEAIEKSTLFDHSIEDESEAEAEVMSHSIPEQHNPFPSVVTIDDEIAFHRALKPSVIEPAISAEATRVSSLSKFNRAVVWVVTGVAHRLHLWGNIASRNQPWRRVQPWLVDFYSTIQVRRQAIEPKVNHLITSGREFTKRFGARIAVTTLLVLSMALLVMKANVSNFHAFDSHEIKMNGALSAPAGDKRSLEIKNSDGSHRRVTDASAAEALADLSRFEMPSLLRQARYGDDAAAFTLGMAFEIGQGVPQNCTKAARWVQEAAQGGVAAAEYNLSLRYRDGDGVPVNLEVSRKWLQKAASLNYAEAVKKAGDLPPTETRAVLVQP